ncbi:MAG: hypothetical protein HGA29_05015 [Syntrophaceae bacterium]|nr:hypothetical protein [Syntrophaceae bacterium]
MAEKTILPEKEAYEIADKFALISAQILEFRIEKREPPLSDEDAAELEKYEDSLDALVVLFRNYGIQLIGKKANEATVELRNAVEAGKKTLKQVNTIKQAINIAGALVDLAVAVLSREPKGILNAAQKVIAAIQ